MYYHKLWNPAPVEAPKELIHGRLAETGGRSFKRNQVTGGGKLARNGLLLILASIRSD